MFLSHSDICDLLLNRRMATWNLFVLYNKEVIKLTGTSLILCVCPPIDHREWPIEMRIKLSLLYKIYLRGVNKMIIILSS